MSDFSWTDHGVRTALGFRAELAESDLTYAGVSTDSRTVSEGDLYVALVGKHFDGHDFVMDAMANGARASVVSRPSPGGTDAHIYPVDDTLVALGMLAAHRRKNLRVPVIAITGSSGKTTTKEMTTAALGGALRVHGTRGNRNNRIGMPMTLLAAPDDAEVVVLELGTNEPGEIRALAQVARPDIAVITTVGESHLEKLGSVDGVLDEKLDLLRELAKGGQCIVGDEPPQLAKRAGALCSRVRVAGWSERADDRAHPSQPQMDVFGRYEFDWRGCRAKVPMAGRHAVSDALIALTVAELMGVSARDAVRGLSTADVGSMRGEFRRIGDLTVIVDCYNANPQSVRASLDVLESQGAAAQKVAVLGTMLELGSGSSALHQEILRDAWARDINLLVVTGEFAVAAQALTAGDGIGSNDEEAEISERLVRAETWRAVYPALKGRLKGDEVVLLKASRGIALEGILPLLSGDFTSADTDSVEA
jgi:UDP-N-acetylmuramoyl-tripeptide--D-alanyl-D-alanine ligase